MSKVRSSGVISEPLSAILGTQAKLSVLRVLSRAGAAIPHREVARRSGMAYRSIDLALQDLLSAGVVEELPEGRERRVRLCAGHRLQPSISALLRAEADFLPALRSELRAAARNAPVGELLSLSMVGSVTRGEELVGEALELVLVGSDEAATNRWRTHLVAAGAGLKERFGVEVKVIGYDLAQARRLWRSRTSKAESSVATAEVLVGLPLLSIMEGH